MIQICENKIGLESLYGFLYDILSLVGATGGYLCPRSKMLKDEIFTVEQERNYALLVPTQDRFISFQEAKELAKEFSRFYELGEVWEMEMGADAPHNRRSAHLNCSVCGVSHLRIYRHLAHHLLACFRQPIQSSNRKVMLPLFRECTQCLQFFWGEDEWKKHQEYHNIYEN